jgi:hypothetical protein
MINLKSIAIFTARCEIEQIVWSSDASVLGLGDAECESQPMLTILSEYLLVFHKLGYDF